ncbi:MAG: hypothetical protein ACRBHB_18190 [Arenicella sp.]
MAFYRSKMYGGLYGEPRRDQNTGSLFDFVEGDDRFLTWDGAGGFNAIHPSNGILTFDGGSSPNAELQLLAGTTYTVLITTDGELPEDTALQILDQGVDIAPSPITFTAGLNTINFIATNSAVDLKIGVEGSELEDPISFSQFVVNLPDQA